MDVKKCWKSTLELVECAYRSHGFTPEWLRYPKYSDYRPLFTTQDEWTIVKYVLEVSQPFQYSTLWMSKRHPIPLHYIIAVFNDMFDHMDGVMHALAMKKTQWKEDLYFAMKFARQKLSKYYSEITPTTGLRLISTHILDPFQKLRSFRK